MKQQELTRLTAGFSQLGKRIKGKIPILAVLAISIAAFATPRFNVLVNQILAMGTASDDLKENLKVGNAASEDQERDAEVQDWQLQLRTHGATDFYSQKVVIAPGGYSGWHTHPGLLIGTVVSGAIDFYDANCQKRSFTTGQVFTESTQVHAIKNPGTVDTELSAFYLIKHSELRRIEADAPSCAPTTGIP